MADLHAAVLRYLPYLRRHARLLTGSQTRGDECVEACLEAVAGDPNRIGATRPRLDLYRTFHEVWRETCRDAGTDAQRQAHGAPGFGETLAQLTPTDRVVLLLVVVEEFTYEEVAELLGMDLAAVREHLHTARQEMKRLASVPVLIIEDELLIAMDIRRIVEEMGHTVCGTASRQSDAVAVAEHTKPALVLADIQLEDGRESGIEAVREILRRLNAPVVFVTAYPERLLTGKTPEPTFVVTKPFQPETLKAVVGQALALSRRTAPAL